MRGLLVRILIRRAWKILSREGWENCVTSYGSLGQILSVLSVLTTAAGVSSRWFPEDVSKDFLKKIKASRKGTTEDPPPGWKIKPGSHWSGGYVLVREEEEMSYEHSTNN